MEKKLSKILLSKAAGGTAWMYTAGVSYSTLQKGKHQDQKEQSRLTSAAYFSDHEPRFPPFPGCTHKVPPGTSTPKTVPENHIIPVIKGDKVSKMQSKEAALFLLQPEWAASASS